MLFTGPAGSGKSSTLAAIVNMLNESRQDHIITVEDPIEYVFAKKKCVVNQRQAGKHTLSFANALRAALREDPDIIVIGELRDLETIQLAITAAETGHLVLGTLHTNNAIRTINRVLDVFPPKQQSQIRAMVSESLRAIVSQRLIPTADGTRRVPALEVLYVKPSVSNLIREEKTFQIRSMMQTRPVRRHDAARRLHRRPGEDGADQQRDPPAASPKIPSASPESNAMARLDALFKLLKDQGGSDLHLAAGMPPAPAPATAWSPPFPTGRSSPTRACARTCRS